MHKFQPCIRISMQLKLQELLKFIERFIYAVIARRAKPDVAIPSEKASDPTALRQMPLEIATTSLWAGFAMTYSFGSLNAQFALQSRSPPVYRTMSLS